MQRKGVAEDKLGEDPIIERGDVLHCDVGITVARLNTDTQHLAYVLRPGEEDAPEGLRKALANANALQDMTMEEITPGRTGNEILGATLARMKARGIQGSVYSHPIGLRRDLKTLLHPSRRKPVRLGTADNAHRWRARIFRQNTSEIVLLQRQIREKQMMIHDNQIGFRGALVHFRHKTFRKIRALLSGTSVPSRIQSRPQFRIVRQKRKLGAVARLRQFAPVANLPE